MAAIMSNAWNHMINDYSMREYAKENICSVGYDPYNTNHHKLL